MADTPGWSIWAPAAPPEVTRRMTQVGNIHAGTWVPEEGGSSLEVPPSLLASAPPAIVGATAAGPWKTSGRCYAASGPRQSQPRGRFCTQTRRRCWRNLPPPPEAAHLGGQACHCARGGGGGGVGGSMSSGGFVSSPQGGKARLIEVLVTQRGSTFDLRLINALPEWWRPHGPQLHSNFLFCFQPTEEYVKAKILKECFRNIK